MFVSIHNRPAGSFLDELPKIAQSHPRALAIFSTYKSINGYEGIARKEVNGLEIVTVQGKTRAQEEAIGIAESYNAYDDNAEHHSIYAHQQRANSESIRKKVDVGVQQFFIAYAGLSNIRECLQHIEDYKSTHKNAVVIVCTCDCRFDDFKGPLMIDYINRGIIDHLSVSPYCSGRHDLGVIADAFVAAWS